MMMKDKFLSLPLILYCKAVINFESNTVIDIDLIRVTDHASPRVACTKNLTKAILLLNNQRC